jgi:hypothetical protein
LTEPFENERWSYHVSNKFDHPASEDGVSQRGSQAFSSLVVPASAPGLSESQRSDQRSSSLFIRFRSSGGAGASWHSLESQAERRCTVSKKHTEIPTTDRPEPETEHTSIVQPMIDELEAESPPELPKDDTTPPPRGPIHPPQPVEHHDA